MLRKGQSGQSLVEFAIFLPAILALLILLVELFGVITEYWMLEHRNREFARWAAKNARFWQSPEDEEYVTFMIETQWPGDLDYVIEVTFVEIERSESDVATVKESDSWTYIQNREEYFFEPYHFQEMLAGHQEIINDDVAQGTPTRNIEWVIVRSVKDHPLVFLPAVRLELVTAAVFRVEYSVRRGDDA